jgi:hypothetical protein
VVFHTELGENCLKRQMYMIFHTQSTNLPFLIQMYMKFHIHLDNWGAILPFSAIWGSEWGNYSATRAA